jgi:DMSO/TMAO reductase YedYZ molybdopterin-dependent catalytic subunit
MLCKTASPLIRHLDSANLLETPLESLGKSWITPNHLFFVLNRSSVETSRFEPEQWSVKFDGLVENALNFKLKELLDPSRFEQIELTSYIQCCGNGRKFFKPPVDGVPWGHGAIGNAVWNGVRLADILKAVRLKPSVQHVMLAGKDAALDPQKPYIKSIPLQKALNPSTVLAFRMNGEDLPVIHGGPIRLIVPGWGGTYSVKWLDHVRATEKPWNGFWMDPAFRIPIHPLSPGSSLGSFESQPFQEFSVSSIITQPLDGQAVQRGIVPIQGFAWTGQSQIVIVDVSTDGGQTWRPAKFGLQRLEYAWTSWRFDWHASLGSHVVMARAKDSLGTTQPLAQDNWNPGGYGWHAVHSITVNVR